MDTNSKFFRHKKLWINIASVTLYVALIGICIDCSDLTRMTGIGVFTILGSAMVLTIVWGLVDRRLRWNEEHLQTD